MSTALHTGPQESAGKNLSPAFRGADQTALFEPSKPSWRDFLRWLLRADLKGFACRVYPGDPEQALINLARILDGKNGRHFDCQWIDLAVEHFGREAEDHFVRFVCDRYGFQPPVRKPDPIREEERIEKLEHTAQEVLAAVRAMAEELASIREGK